MFRLNKTKQDNVNATVTTLINVSSTLAPRQFY